MKALCCVARRIGHFAHAFVRACVFVACTLAGSGVYAQTTGQAIEYYHAGFNHYFITAIPGEISALDGGAFGGVWSRTGRTIPVWTEAGAGTSETCRFFSATFAPKSSHFYTPYGSECTSLQQGTAWTYEGIVFHLRVDAAGQCPAGTTPLYRLYNNNVSGAPNHRYTASSTVFDAMRALGWTPEGAGPQIVFACAPAQSTSVAMAGYWTGTSSLGEQVVGIVLDDGTFEFVYSSDAAMGVVEGTATVTGQTFTATSAHDLVIRPNPGEYAGSLSGSLASATSMSGTLGGSRGNRTFAATYAGPLATSVSLAQIAGAFDGFAATKASFRELIVNVAASGSFAGNASGCTVNGALTPRAVDSIMDVALSYGPAGCPLGNAQARGIAIYVPALQGLLIVSRSASRDDAFVFAGMK